MRLEFVQNDNEKAKAKGNITIETMIAIFSCIVWFGYILTENVEYF